MVVAPGDVPRRRSSLRSWRPCSSCASSPPLTPACGRSKPARRCPPRNVPPGLRQQRPRHHKARRRHPRRCFSQPSVTSSSRQCSGHSLRDCCRAKSSRRGLPSSESRQSVRWLRRWRRRALAGWQRRWPEARRRSPPARWRLLPRSDCPQHAPHGHGQHHEQAQQDPKVTSADLGHGATFDGSASPRASQ